MSSSKKSTQHGYPFNTTVEFNCLKGFKLSGSKVFTCESSGHWKGEKPACMREMGSTLLTTPTSSSSKATHVELDETADSNSNCRLDLSMSELESLANEVVDGGSNKHESSSEFVFINQTSNRAAPYYLSNGLSISYYCRTNEMLHYVAKCMNGSLIMEHNCNQQMNKRIFHDFLLFLFFFLFNFNSFNDGC
jgi:hypothetical protein